ncbi:murein hydrolase activator EnvC family protein [Hyphomicrobium sulfonivorans]|uniref:murein hydrolase activator EnvC family protein n=1 Tax=Hyphomicrobium sulfonivorans TaxID=121290 RepID=UPI0015712779|nr:peptidoglycan DD-metalloendopeptidase family protein [Hyphomicrobium sulfonivorans]MBI1648418.1 peptidoglycan DD-metalloendopeptidase family protein [Hyphomicrobium sulfonivorans]NSL71046.1 peptidase M23 [Hyphomicrobium sulfonivorans]
MTRARLTLSTHHRSRLLAAVLAITGVAAPVCLSTAAAQERSKPASAEEAKNRLEHKQQELQNVQQRAKSLEGDVDGLAAERERLNTQLMDTAKIIKDSEGKLTDIESRLEELESQERILRGSLSQRNDQIAKLLGALQRMGRNPPPAIITEREDALEMVRSAMLLSAAFPELGNQAQALLTRLNELARVTGDIRSQRDKLRSEMAHFSDARVRLSGLMQEKSVALDERQSELKQMRTAAADISRNVNNLNDLIVQLDKAVQTNTGLGAYEAQRAREKPNITPNSSSASDAPTPIDTPPAAPAADVKAASAKSAEKEFNVVELAPSTALGRPGRIEPEVEFIKAKGLLPLPAQGRKVLNFGDKTQYGGQSKGIVFETRQGAQVTSPCDGWIVYAGEFRSYGQLLIINAGDGYHVLLAGLSQIDVQPGQFVLAAEPIGTMSGWSQQTRPVAANSAPVLYVEFRKDGRPVNPDPWWAARDRKVQG